MNKKTVSDIVGTTVNVGPGGGSSSGGVHAQTVTVPGVLNKINTPIGFNAMGQPINTYGNPVPNAAQTGLMGAPGAPGYPPPGYPAPGYPANPYGAVSPYGGMASPYGSPYGASPYGIPPQPQMPYGAAPAYPYAVPPQPQMPGYGSPYGGGYAPSPMQSAPQPGVPVGVNAYGQTIDAYGNVLGGGYGGQVNPYSSPGAYLQPGEYVDQYGNPQIPYDSSGGPLDMPNYNGPGGEQMSCVPTHVAGFRTMVNGQPMGGGYRIGQQYEIISGWLDDLGHTLDQYKGDIEAVAPAAAAVLGTALGGPMGGAAASQLASATIQSAYGDPVSKQVKDAAAAAAKQDPAAAAIAQIAGAAVSGTVQAYHAASLTDKAASGDAKAKAQLKDLGNRAKAGDPNAKLGANAVAHAASKMLDTYGGAINLIAASA